MHTTYSRQNLRAFTKWWRESVAVLAVWQYTANQTGVFGVEIAALCLLKKPLKLVLKDDCNR
jgi:hypothetical protein